MLCLYLEARCELAFWSSNYSLADETYIRYIISIVNIVYTKKSMGRKKEYPERLTLPLKTETLEEIDENLVEGETRLDLIRSGIDRELKHRRRNR